MPDLLPCITEYKKTGYGFSVTGFSVCAVQHRSDPLLYLSSGSFQGKTESLGGVR